MVVWVMGWQYDSFLLAIAECRELEIPVVSGFKLQCLYTKWMVI